MFIHDNDTIFLNTIIVMNNKTGTILNRGTSKGFNNLVAEIVRHAWWQEPQINYKSCTVQAC